MGILQKYDLFIFDWDNTLTTSPFLNMLVDIVKYGSKLRYAKSHEDEFKVDEDALRMDQRVESTIGLRPLIELYELVLRPRLKNDSLQVLKFLKDHRKKVAVFSDAKGYRLAIETKRFGAIKYLDMALAAESIKHYKPDPTGLLMISRRLKIPKKRAIYIGDMATDALTAKFAGIDSCIIPSGIDTPERIRDAKPNYSFTSIAEFINSRR